MTAVGTSVEAVKAAAGKIKFFDGTAATNVAVASLYQGPAAQAGKTIDPTLSVAKTFHDNLGTAAMADLNGSRVFIRPNYFNCIGTGFAPAVVMHELLHNMTGETDDGLQRALGLPTNQASQNITLKLLADCVMR